jgi:hypothetical protein
MDDIALRLTDPAPALCLLDPSKGDDGVATELR